MYIFTCLCVFSWVGRGRVAGNVVPYMGDFEAGPRFVDADILRRGSLALLIRKPNMARVWLALWQNTRGTDRKSPVFGGGQSPNRSNLEKNQPNPNASHTRCFSIIASHLDPKKKSRLSGCHVATSWGVFLSLEIMTRANTRRWTGWQGGGGLNIG